MTVYIDYGYEKRVGEVTFGVVNYLGVIEENVGMVYLVKIGRATEDVEGNFCMNLTDWNWLDWILTCAGQITNKVAALEPNERKEYQDWESKLNMFLGLEEQIKARVEYLNGVKL